MTPHHTPRDLADLILNGHDPDNHQPRERSVPCWQCRRPTWNRNGVCDQCQPNPQQERTVTTLSIDIPDGDVEATMAAMGHAVTLLGYCPGVRTPGCTLDGHKLVRRVADAIHDAHHTMYQHQENPLT